MKACSTQEVGVPSTCRGRQQCQDCSEPTENKAGVKEIYRMEHVKFLEKSSLHYLFILSDDSRAIVLLPQI